MEAGRPVPGHAALRHDTSLPEWPFVSVGPGRPPPPRPVTSRLVSPSHAQQDEKLCVHLTKSSSFHSRPPILRPLDPRCCVFRSNPLSGFPIKVSSSSHATVHLSPSRPLSRSPAFLVLSPFVSSPVPLRLKCVCHVLLICIHHPTQVIAP